MTGPGLRERPLIQSGETDGTQLDRSFLQIRGILPWGKKTIFSTERLCAPTTITYDLITPVGSVGFTAGDWLTGPVSPSATLNLLRYGLRPPERACSA
ncbi:hypothetical protein ElyMa_006344300 [Elysia marginata]|uniref:Uncharacterized protein n=1 Tax=Elysia marginata TaxID=1093978 RepID=A0AAV4HN58_9GAST|nr:hypothetical protein ElyMa_006344300 [Elysia marginata]